MRSPPSRPYARPLTADLPRTGRHYSCAGVVPLHQAIKKLPNPRYTFSLQKKYVVNMFQVEMRYSQCTFGAPCP